MLLTTSDAVEGRSIARTLGLVYGAVTRSSSMLDRMRGFLKAMLGGEVEEHTKTLAEAREHALDRMREHARSLGANGIVAVRFSSVEISSWTAEVLVYGTAVVLEA